jgi:hypothetical protein
MPAVQPAPIADPIERDRFVPAIQRVETENYNKRTLELIRDQYHRLGQSAFLTVKYGLINANSELHKISGIGHGWDSYGSDSPSAAAIRETKGILAELAGALILPSTIVPSAGGGVSAYFICGDRTAYVESYNSGTQALVMYDRAGFTEVFEIGTDIQRAEVSGRILAYLG